MDEDHTPHRRLDVRNALADLVSAFALLTVLPARWLSRNQPGRIVAWFPLVGVVIGASLAGVASLTFLPSDVTRFITLLTWVVFTGGLHLDGFADSCDGLLATTSPERRLEIMKDPRAGSWAVIGVGLLLLGKWAALKHVAPLWLIAPPTVGRWIMGLAIYAFPNARPGGMGATMRAGLERRHLAIATLLVLPVLVGLGWQAVPAFGVALGAALLAGRWAAARLGGGLTGDVYGALCELAELICLLTLTLLPGTHS
ncbi:MAG: adenosylcobinamide-GDP ribazoletransferase [Anaerolineae bacterium]|nr:adenosylcobinamide-GDP ribazoletransferase [Thermoflexales bacterium]MDW8407903.1 adenosylcobinamide-GDP ribazoletransferase [Anaerolineae bacterium]